MIVHTLKMCTFYFVHILMNIFSNFGGLKLRHILHSKFAPPALCTFDDIFGSVELRQYEGHLESS